MEKSNNEIFGYFGNETKKEYSIQADDSIQTKCYESDTFQTFQKTASLTNFLNFFAEKKEEK